MTLDIRWIRSDILVGSEWYDGDELFLYHGSWDAGWNGMFRRMKITVTMEGTPIFKWGDETLTMTKKTEDITKRLVGGDTGVAHFELTGSSYPDPKLDVYEPNWTKGIVAERKI